MGLLTVDLIPLQKDDREQFILDNQRAFWYGGRQEFGMQELLEETGYAGGVWQEWRTWHSGSSGRAHGWSDFATWLQGRRYIFAVLKNCI